MLKKSVMFLVLLILLTISVTATQEPYHLKLLAVQEADDGYIGSGADLFLELREGSGRVFLETNPLTKLDTQISTRFAKDIACNHFKLNCQKYDFIYTIRAESNIIGGPSAGAAVAALTTIAVLDLDHDETVTITGTINSGGIVGPVGGVKEKLDAAQEIGLKKVLVSIGTSVQPDFNNTNLTEESLDLVSYAQNNLSLAMVEVMDLDDVIFHLTGEDLNHQEVIVTENKQYTEIMQGLKRVLCERTAKIELELDQERVFLNENVTTELFERKGSAENATLDQDYYSAASYCFANNILLRTQYYQAKMPTSKAIENLYSVLESKTSSLKQKLAEEEIKTISDLQTLMIVKERLNDVSENIAKFNEQKELGFIEREEAYQSLAYAEERFFSALSWKQFFAMEGKNFNLNPERLKNSCQQKISEAEERHQYVSLFLGLLPVINIQEKITQARAALTEEEYELCLIVASQAKADSNAILSSIGLSEESFSEYLESKSKAVERVIFENSAEEIFPILGYSYYQYANSLQEQEPYTALLYLEYALEMSELSIYFPEEQTFFELEFRIDRVWYYAGIGFLIGFLVAFVIFFGFVKRRPKLKLIHK
ncbi:MAG: hypothetical protein KJ597_04110 [Nanoarchaeota archaeon]|nr:hypothetical protein [Nanoarchaeota archaeon]MBU1622732.1 hypothetical protein [Nanoarchaeota archaeon]